MSERQASLEEKRTANVAIMWKKEVADLRAKFEAKEKEEIMWFNKYSKSADNETVLFEQAILAKKERDIWCEKYLTAEQERDNLQAANGVLRDALEKTRKAYLNARQHHIQEDCTCDDCNTVKNAGNVLKFTPPEAGERVQGLVEALEQIANYNIKYQSGEIHIITVLEEFNYFVTTARDELAKYRRCGK